MTENEAIKNIKALNAVCWDKDFYDEEFAKAMAKAVKALHEIQQYRTIGTIEEFKALKEKSMAKKAQYDEYGKEEGYPYCSCGKCLIDDFVGASYCPNCGQKLDWQ